MRLVKKQRRQLCGLGELENGERGAYMAVVKERCGYHVQAHQYVREQTGTIDVFGAMFSNCCLLGATSVFSFFFHQDMY